MWVYVQYVCMYKGCVAISRGESGVEIISHSSTAGRYPLVEAHLADCSLAKRFIVKMEMPASIASVLDSVLDVIYGLQPLVEPTVVLGKKKLGVEGGYQGGLGPFAER